MRQCYGSVPPHGSQGLNNSQMLAWMVAASRADRRSLHAWARAAGVPSNALYRLRTGEHKTMSPANLAKLAAVTSVPPPNNPRHD